jgi:hypothetical protein
MYPHPRILAQDYSSIIDMHFDILQQVPSIPPPILSRNPQTLHPHL